MYEHIFGLSQPASDTSKTSSKGLLKVLTCRLTGDLQGTFQRTNGKSDNFTIKLYFGSNTPNITYLFLYFTGEASIPKSQMEKSPGLIHRTF